MFNILYLLTELILIVMGKLFFDKKSLELEVFPMDRAKL